MKYLIGKILSNHIDPLTVGFTEDPAVVSSINTSGFKSGPLTPGVVWISRRRGVILRYLEVTDVEVVLRVKMERAKLVCTRVVAAAVLLVAVADMKTKVKGKTHPFVLNLNAIPILQLAVCRLFL